MHPSFRFIHASDLHLERPPRGLADVPDPLRSSLADASYRAGQRVFDAAIKEAVDFVLLAGDVIDPGLAGPPGIVFLEEQFARLAAAGISVYWAGGQHDRFDQFRESWPLGNNVTRFPLDRVTQVVHERGGQPIARILGTSNLARKRIKSREFHAEPNGLFTLALAYGLAGAKSLATAGVHYWALGGRHRRRSIAARGTTAHYPGTPQARRPQETGPRGCTLVAVDQQRHLRTRFIATDAARYADEHLKVEAGTPHDAAYSLLSARALELASDPFGPDVLIRWTVAGDGSLARALEHGRLGSDLAERLRREHGSRRPAVWTVAIEPQRSDVPAEMYEEKTVRGEFLRTVRQHALEAETPIDLNPFLGPQNLTAGWQRAVAIEEPRVRMRVLAQVAHLGSELLSELEETRR